MTVGSATLITDILELLAIENVYSDQEGYFQVDPEDMLSRRPKVILFPTVAADQERSRALLLSERVGSNPSLVTIDPDLLIRPGPRLLEGIQILRKKLTEI
jgi:ABC-type Fe3+-hydroxamate transport system substrate-binding protein